MEHVGAQETFAIFSACSLATLVLYSAYVNIFTFVCPCLKSTTAAIRTKLRDPAQHTSGEEKEQLLMSDEDPSETFNDFSDENSELTSEQ